MVGLLQMTICAFKMVVEGWKWGTLRLGSELGSLRKWCSLWIGINILFWISVLLPFISAAWVGLDCSWRWISSYVNGLQQESSRCVSFRGCRSLLSLCWDCQRPHSHTSAAGPVSGSGTHWSCQMQRSLELPWVTLHLLGKYSLNYT